MPINDCFLLSRDRIGTDGGRKLAMSVRGVHVIPLQLLLMEGDSEIDQWFSDARSVVGWSDQDLVLQPQHARASVWWNCKALPPVLWSEVRTGLDVVLSREVVNCCTVLEWTGCSAHV